jgi:hypothetical protein
MKAIYSIPHRRNFISCIYILLFILVFFSGFLFSIEIAKTISSIAVSVVLALVWLESKTSGEIHVFGIKLNINYNHKLYKSIMVFIIIMSAIYFCIFIWLLLANKL